MTNVQVLFRQHEFKRSDSLAWLGNMNLTVVSIELDCWQVVDGIASKFSTNFKLGAILNYFKVSLRFFPNFNISFIMRQENSVIYCYDHMSSCIEKTF
jgi:hypothetical protein